MQRKKAYHETQVDNESVTVTLWRFQPGEETGHHIHGHDYVIVPLSDGFLESHAKGGVDRFELKAGQAYARPQGVEHNIVCPGPKAFAFVEIEIKS